MMDDNKEALNGLRKGSFICNMMLWPDLINRATLSRDKKELPSHRWKSLLISVRA